MRARAARGLGGAQGGGWIGEWMVDGGATRWRSSAAAMARPRCLQGRGEGGELSPELL